MNFWPEEYDAEASLSALKNPGGGQLNTKRMDLKLFLNSKVKCIFLF
jgi:hypothetical protein